MAKKPTAAAIKAESAALKRQIQDLEAEIGEKNDEIKVLKLKLDGYQAWITKAGHAASAGTHLADTVDGLLDAINELAEAEAEVADGSRDPDTLAGVHDAQKDNWSGVRNAAHEYRKRAKQMMRERDRLEMSTAAIAPKPPDVYHVETWEEHYATDRMAYALHELTANLFRCVRGAGKPYMILSQIYEVAERVSELHKLQSRYSFGWSFNAAITNMSSRHGAYSEIIRCALQLVASDLSPNTSLYNRSANEMADAIEEFSARAAKRRAARKKPTRPPVIGPEADAYPFEERD